MPLAFDRATGQKAPAIFAPSWLSSMDHVGWGLSAADFRSCFLPLKITK